MKKIVLLGAMTFACIGVFAQTETTSPKNKKNDGQTTYDNKQSNGQPKTKSTSKNCSYIMENGKVMKYANGKKVTMEKDMTLKNGTVLMTDGTMKMKDGKTTKMKEGECMDTSGKMMSDKKSSAED
jgi:hypothetical protein